MISDLADWFLIKREPSAADHIVASALLEDGRTVRTRTGDLFQVVKIAPVECEARSHEERRGARERLNGLYKSLHHPRTAFHAHVIRRRIGLPDLPPCTGFAGEIAGAYRTKLLQAPMFANDHYLTVVVKPELSGFTRKIDKAAYARLENAARAELETKVSEVLRHFKGRRLGRYEANGIAYSEPCEFLARLLNGYDQPIAEPRRDLSRVLLSSAILVGKETIRLDMPENRSRHMAVLAINTYPDPCPPWALDALLDLPGEFVLSQSFTCVEFTAAKGRAELQGRRFQASEDAALSQAMGIGAALDELVSHRVVRGDHNFGLALIADDPDELDALLADARQVMSEAGCIPARERKALEGQMWAQLPGAFGYRPRASDISSANFASLAPFHDRTATDTSPQHWGSHAALFTNFSGTPVAYGLHVQDVGHTLIVGPTGSGKTVLQNYMLACLDRFGATRILFDKDRGAELFVRASGGSYSVIRVGEPSGFAPFSLEPTPANLDLINRLVLLLTYPNGDAAAADEEEIAAAIEDVYALPPEQRRLARVMDGLKATRPDGPRRRLTKWVDAGRFAWLFDNEIDTVALREGGLSAFDVTEFLDQEEVRGPCLFYLLSRVRQMMTGHPGVLAIDEFARALADATLRDFVDDMLRTARKQNFAVFAATQSPHDVTNSPIAATILGQCATKVVLPNAVADRGVYGPAGFGLTQDEVEAIRVLPPRTFLVKRGERTGVLRLDLAGLDEMLTILSGRTGAVRALDRIRAEVGDDPAAWRPRLRERLAGGWRL